MRSDAIFPALLMGFNGWGLVFNLWAFVRGCEAEAFTLDYPTEGNAPDRAMSPRVSTALFAAFWATGTLLLVTATA